MPRKKKEFNSEYVLLMNRPLMYNDGIIRRLVYIDTDVLRFIEFNTIVPQWSYKNYTVEEIKSLLGLDKNTKLVIKEG